MAKSTQGTFLPSCLLKRKWSFKASPLLLIKSSRYKLKTFNPHTFHCVGSFQFDLDTTKLNFVPVRLIFEVSIPRFRLWQFLLPEATKQTKHFNALIKLVL